MMMAVELSEDEVEMERGREGGGEWGKAGREGGGRKEGGELEGREIGGVRQEGKLKERGSE